VAGAEGAPINGIELVGVEIGADEELNVLVVRLSQEAAERLSLQGWRDFTVAGKGQVFVDDVRDRRI
jgi:hypothetical protein